MQEHKYKEQKYMKKKKSKNFLTENKDSEQYKQQSRQRQISHKPKRKRSISHAQISAINNNKVNSRNLILLEYMKPRPYKISQKSKHINILQKALDSSIQINRDNKKYQKRANSQLIIQSNLPKFYKQPKRACSNAQIKFQKSKQKLNIQKYQNIVQGIIKKQKSSFIDRDQFLNNHGIYFRYNKMNHKRIITELPKILSSNRISLQPSIPKQKPKINTLQRQQFQNMIITIDNRKETGKIIKNNHYQTEKDIQHIKIKSQKIRTQPVDIEYDYYQNINNEVKLQKAKKNNVSLLKKMKKIQESELTPWQNQLKTTHIYLPSITKYNN